MLDNHQFFFLVMEEFWTFLRSQWRHQIIHGMQKKPFENFSSSVYALVRCILFPELVVVGGWCLPPIHSISRLNGFCGCFRAIREKLRICELRDQNILLTQLASRKKKTKRIGNGGYTMRRQFRKEIFLKATSGSSHSMCKYSLTRTEKHQANKHFLNRFRYGMACGMSSVKTIVWTKGKWNKIGLLKKSFVKQMDGMLLSASGQWVHF